MIDGHHGGADDTCDGREQHPYQGHRDAEAAAQCPEEPAERVEKFLGYPCPLQRNAHEDEQRHGNERLVGHDAENPVRQTRQQGVVEDARGGTCCREQQRGTTQREGDRKPCEQDHDHRREQQ